MDKRIVESFWRQRASLGTTRWTGDEMLDFDRSLLIPLCRNDSAILDLGSGFGELSRSICSPDGQLVAVDAEAGMASGFAGDPRFSFVHSSIADFETAKSFDLVLLFGVITHMTTAEETETYRRMLSWLKPQGIAVVKNQCADGEAFEVDTFSESLGVRYVGRYPSTSEQRSRLSAQFRHVETIRYPAALKHHDNSTHIAFICDSPRNLV
jgi:cyclopropane fatty-acyl-phospholipid synthase-like methyltransferase